MPKGKPRTKFADLYEDEGAEKMQQRSLAPQSAPHRRGGTHRVKDEHLTGTHWDDKNYQELLIAAKDAKVWRKDMPKHQMAQALANKDREDAITRRKAEREAERKKKELTEQKQHKKEEKERLRREKEGKRIVRQRRRAIGEGVNDTTDSESEEEEERGDVNVGFGQLQSDEETIESHSTSTTTHVSLSPIFPSQRLRIFEWPYPDMAPSNPSRVSLSPSTQDSNVTAGERLLRKLPYLVLNVVTTVTGEAVELPGRGYPEEIAPDYVPVLTQHIRDCAHNGVLVGPLRKAVIESGEEWAWRTIIQGWNGCMFFQLPPRKSTVNLADVYAKWKGKKAAKAKPQRGAANRVNKTEAKRKKEQRKEERKEKILDEYTASEYRPPICYVPAFLDDPLMVEDGEMPRTLENLFFIRFPSVAVPHYYFWTLPGEWEDPTVPNPDWQKEGISGRKDPPPETVGEGYRVRVKKPTTPHRVLLSTEKPKTSKYKEALWSIERDLYHYGFARTLYKLRAKLLEEDRYDQWKCLMVNLPVLYPSGQLPNVPPVQPNPYTTSLAEKLAAVVVPSLDTVIEPIKGEEAWTRDDDAYWDIVEAPEEDEQEEEHEAEDEAEVEEDLDETIAEAAEALHRRVSELVPWLYAVSPSFEPPIAPTQAPKSPARRGLSKRSLERAEWEQQFLTYIEGDGARERKRRGSQPKGRNRSVPESVSQLQQMPVEELKWHISTLTKERPQSEETCKICLEALEKGKVDTARAHYEQHRQESDEMCPFCGMPWATLESHIKAAHIFTHHMDESTHRPRRTSDRSSNNFPLYSILNTRRKSTLCLAQQKGAAEASVAVQPRSMSKVSFSPVTVEKRIACNDVEDAGMDGDISSRATSPRYSSLRKTTITLKASKKSRKSNLKVDTSARPPVRSTIRHSNVKGDTKKRNLSILSTPFTASSSATSPEFRSLSRSTRYTEIVPEAPWNPRLYDTSGSEHVPSPYLPQLKKLPVQHPNAAYDPRKASKSSVESLELYTGRRGAQKREDNGKEKAVGQRQGDDQPVRRKARGKGKPKAVKSAEVQPEDGDVIMESQGLSEYESRRRYAKTKGKSKVTDATYRDERPRSSSEGERSPVLKKRKRPADPSYPNQRMPSSPSTGGDRPLAKRRKRKTKTMPTAKRTKTGKAPQALENYAPIREATKVYGSSTISNPSSSDIRRENDVQGSWLNGAEVGQSTAANAAKRTASMDLLVSPKTKSLVPAAKSTA